MPVLFIFFPLFAVVLLNLPVKETGKRIALWSGLTVCVIQMAMAAVFGSLAWRQVDNAIAVRIVTSFSIDFFSAVVLFTIGLVAFISLIVARYSSCPDRFSFINLILLAMMGMNGVAMVTDLFTLYIFLEITAVASFILIALDKLREGLEGAFKYFVMSAVASIFMLSAIAFVFMLTGETGFKEIGRYISGLNGAYPFQLILAFILFTTGLSIKAGLVPFHGWVPDAYSSAPSAVSTLLAGIVTKVAGVYTLMRLFKDVFGNVKVIGNTLIVLGLVSIVIGALAAIGQNDFKRILAYSSISQVGYIILGAGLGTPLGFTGALLHFFNHSTFKSLLFVDSTAVELQTGTRDMKKLGGLASRMPVTGGTSIVGFLSTAGIPPLSGFWSKFLIIVAAWKAASYVSAAVALLASILTLAYFLILQRNMFFGKVAGNVEGVTECNRGITGAALLLSAITLATGLLFPIVLVFLQAQGLI